MKNGCSVVFGLVFCIAANALELRGLYIEQNQKDVRLEINIRNWWENPLQGSLTIPAGTQVRQTTGSTVDLSHSLSLHSAISITLINSSASQLRKRSTYPMRRGPWLTHCGLSIQTFL